jgi:hypothetical protein
MLFRNLTWVLSGIALCGTGAYAANLGFQVDGSRPAQAPGFSSNATLPIANTVTLANGDIYSVTGTPTSTNNASGGSLALTYLFQAIYLGNGNGGASQADSLTLDAFSAYQSMFGTGNFTEILAGTFGSSIAGAPCSSPRHGQAYCSR